MIDIWDAVLDQLDPSRRVRFETPGELARHLYPDTVQTPALDIVDAEFMRVLAEPDARLILTMPPQEGKSQRLSKVAPVFALLQNPDLRIIAGSYGQALANTNGRAVRNAIVSHPELGLQIAADHGSASEWSIAGHRGGLVSVGRGAGVAGRPADLMLIDDPLKDRAEADSKTIRDATWDWWTDAMATRLSPGAPVIVVSTRWHEDDLVGRLLERNASAGWRRVNIAAQCEDPTDDPLGREAGEFLQSARGRTRAQWEARKAAAGARGWAALYQGHPSPTDGDIFKRGMLRRYTEPFDTTGWRFVQSWDLSFGGGKTSDYVVGQVWAKHGRMHRLVDQVRGRWDFVETIDQMRALRAAWPQTTTTLIEAKANGAAAIASLQREGFTGIVPVVPRESKEARALASTPLWEAGDVELPATALAPWIDGLVEEFASFPNGTHDDQVDAAVQALAYLSPMGAQTTNRAYSF